MQSPKPSLADPDIYEKCRERIERLTPEMRPRWGKMSVGQMLAHCAEVQEVMNGKPLEGTPWLLRLVAPLIKRAVLAGRPYPKGARTHPQYVQVMAKDFEVEKRRLLNGLESFRAMDLESGVRHAIFGRLTADEAGWGSYKHLDHHLTQFGV